MKDAAKLSFNQHFTEQKVQKSPLRTHLVDGAGRLLPHLAAACAEDLGEVLSSSEKMSNRDFTLGAESRTQWRVNFTQLISACLQGRAQEREGGQLNFI